MSPSIYQKRPAERGLITIMALLIMTALLALSIGYVRVTMFEGNMVKMLRKADEAREAALAGTRLAAGALIKDLIDDGASPYDGLDEDWFNLTNKTTDGSIDPWPLDPVEGVYFQVTVIDMDARVRYNTSAALQGDAKSLIEALPLYTATQRDNITANNYMTIMENGRSPGLGNEMMTYLSPYGDGTDIKVNVNTVDSLDNGGSSDPPDVLNSILFRIYNSSSGTIVPNCGNTVVATNSNAGPLGDFARSIMRFRRGAAAGLSDIGTATNPDLELTGGVGHGGPYAVVQDDPHYEFGPGPLRSTKTITVAGGASRPGEFCRQGGGGNCTAVPRRAYGLCLKWMKEANTSGVFLIRSLGWVLVDPSAADKVHSARMAQYQVLHILKRTTSGYDDLYHREWWQDRQDMYNAGYTTGDYDWENTIYVYDKDKL